MPRTSFPAGVSPGSIDADPQYVEAVLGLAEKAALPGLSVRVGNANWDQRHNIKGYDGAMYPLPPWQPAGGFTVDRATLPEPVVETHVSLFDGTNAGIALKNRPVFSVQHHPEASPGPTDSLYLFERFAGLMDAAK